MALPKILGPSIFDELISLQLIRPVARSAAAPNTAVPRCDGLSGAISKVGVDPHTVSMV